MSDQPKQKPMMSNLDLGQMAQLYKQVNAMPENTAEQKAAKEQRKAYLHEFAGQILEEMDPPVEPIRPDMALLKAGATALGYGSGIKDTILGEGAKLLRKEPELIGAPMLRKEGYSLQDAKDAGKALLGAVTAGYAGKQKSLADYRHEMGIGDGPSLADTEWGQRHGLDKNKWYVPTLGGVGDFAIGVLTDPALVSRAMKKGAAKQLEEQLSKLSYKEGADLLKQRLADQNAPLFTKRGLMNAGEKTAHAIADPVGAAGEAAIKWRFRNADKATKAAGKQPFSDTWMRGNREGYTSEGIREGIDQEIASKENLIDQIQDPTLVTSGEMKDMGLPGNVGNQNFLPVRSQSQVLSHLRNPDGSIPNELQNIISKRPGVTQAYKAAREDILNEFRAAAHDTPGLGDIYERDRLRAGMPAKGGPDQGILRETPPQVTTVERTTQPHTVNEFGGFKEGESVYPGAKSGEVPPGTPIPEGADVSMEGYTIGGQPKMRVTVPQDRVVPERTPIWQQKTTPGQTVGTTRIDSAPIAHELPAPTDILDPSRYERYFTPKELRAMARDYQQKARASSFYSQPTKFDPKTKEALKNIEGTRALGKLQHQTGMRARGLEMEALDEMQHGLGGQVNAKYKDISSLLEGAPYLDRPFMGKGKDYGVSLGRRMFYKNPVLGAVTDALTGTGDVLSMVGGKTALSPLGWFAQNVGRQKLPEYYNYLKSQNSWGILNQLQKEIEQDKEKK